MHPPARFSTPMPAQLPDVLIVGGGAIGLSLAYELAQQGARATVVERGQPGREASWAGAGILPPARRRPQDIPWLQLAGLSNEVHARWHHQLREETGIDTGYRRCGGLYVARTAAESTAMQLQLAFWQELDIPFETLSRAAWERLEPAMAAPAVEADWQDVWLAADEAQVRNPRHLRALIAACQARGVEIRSGVAVEDVVVRDGHVAHLATSAGELVAGAFCVAAGAWSKTLLARCGVSVPLRPMRGQMVLLHCGQRILSRIINDGPRYVVPRDDGRVLVGSTEEDVGFDCRTTAEATHDLLQMALELAPGLRGAALERTWAGLRPFVPQGYPFLGRLPGLDNAFVACGHFRSGLQLSTGTAVLMAQLLCGRTPEISLEPFQPGRE